jgi:hypothetical protein
MSQEAKGVSESSNNSVDCASLTEEFNKNLFITDKYDSLLQHQNVSLEVNGS